MENQGAVEKMKTKRLLIICGCVIAVAAIALAGVLVLTNRNQNSLPDMFGRDGAIGIADMTFEQFSMGMREDLPAETLEEVKRLFEELQQATAGGDMERVSEINREIASLDLYDIDLSDMQSGNVMVFDSEGNAVNPEDLPDELKEIFGN